MCNILLGRDCIGSIQTLAGKGLTIVFVSLVLCTPTFLQGFNKLCCCCICSLLLELAFFCEPVICMLYMWIARASVTKYLYTQVNSLILLFVVMFLENVLCASFRSQISNDVLKQQMHLFLLIFFETCCNCF